MDLTSPKCIKELMGKYGKHFAKSLGQNFLIDPKVLESIATAANIDENSLVLEIGPGIGSLTSLLAKRAKRVVSVEIDKNLIPLLNETVGFNENVKIINSDVLKVDLQALVKEHFGGEKIKVCANLPYYITTPILLYLIQNHSLFSSITLMVQKEVALRMAAKPGTADYGSLTPFLMYYANVKIAAHIPGGAFMPMPKVTSSVVHLDILPYPSVAVKSPDILFKLIRAAFSQRRKTLTNTLSSSGLCDKDAALNILEKLNLRPDIRGEKLSLSEFALFADEIYSLRNES